MVRLTKKQIQREIIIWRRAALPGIAVLIFVIVARLLGWLQIWEWFAFDTFLRWRPAELTDEKIVIIGINEQDIQSIGNYPIPDQQIAELIRILQKHQPIAIGLDIIKNIPVEPGYTELVDVFQQNKKLVGIEKILPPDPILPPPRLPAAQVGFSDLISDDDGKYRRYLLWTPSDKNPDNPNEAKYSLSVRLAMAYLAAQGINLERGKNDSETMRFAATELPRFLPNSGGYVRANDSGLKILVNFRNGSKPFRVLSLHDIKNGNFKSEWLKGKIALIGVTAPSVPDLFNSSAIASLKLPGQVYGVEFHAHACSQIINAVVEERSLLKSWSDGWEYLWIFVWGFIPIIIGRITQSVWKNYIAVVIVGCCLVGIGYLLILWGWWIPIVPNLLILCVNGLGMSAFAFYQHDQAQKSKIIERQQTIEHAFNIIHNGPLQTLANILRYTHTHRLPQEELTLQLEKLNYEIRAIGEYLKIEALSPDESLRLGSGLKLDLKRPMHELFYEVYTSTLERSDLEYLKNIKVKIRTFDPIDYIYLTLENKQGLCLFLEEALCNVGKHAKGVKNIEATGIEDQGLYTLKIKDNGSGTVFYSESKGTKQLKSIAKNLKGNFKRDFLVPGGTTCEITWKLTKNKTNN
ncbi:MAG: CHASE2 domain-containing protein [Desmonostoc vinosum HA7617-LM4]|jgi:CHASE2 domain-containing sensor protein|nr:CHASE2 domain-containing protein [Desmonostoc vinosum HA7617-LM4]